MKLENVGEIIASRTFVLQRENEPTSEVHVLLGRPQRDGADFFCPHQIKGVGLEVVRSVYGVDAFQAIQLSISLLQFEVGMLQKEMNGNLSWEGGEVTDFGFPTVG